MSLFEAHLFSRFKNAPTIMFRFHCFALFFRKIWSIIFFSETTSTDVCNQIRIRLTRVVWWFGQSSENLMVPHSFSLNLLTWTCEAVSSSILLHRQRVRFLSAASNQWTHIWWLLSWIELMKPVLVFGGHWILKSLWSTTLLAYGAECRIFFREEFLHLRINLKCFVNNSNTPSFFSTIVHIILVGLTESDRSFDDSIRFGSMWGRLVMIPRQFFASFQELQACFQEVKIASNCSSYLVQSCFCTDQLCVHWAAKSCTTTAFTSGWSFGKWMNELFPSRCVRGLAGICEGGVLGIVSPALPDVQILLPVLPWPVLSHSEISSSRSPDAVRARLPDAASALLLGLVSTIPLGTTPTCNWCYIFGLLRIIFQARVQLVTLSIIWLWSTCSNLWRQLWLLLS